MKKLILLAVVTAFMFATAAYASDTSWQKVADKGEIVVGFAAHYPPFESKNEKTGELEGFDVDMARALAGQLGVKVKFVDAEWQGLLGGLMKGEYDVLITCMAMSEARGKNVVFSDVYYELPDIIVVRSDDNSIKDEKDLQGKVVGVQLGSSSEQVVDKMSGFKDVRRYNYNPEAFLDLKHKRIDALVVGYAYAVNQIKADPSYKVTGGSLNDSKIVMVGAKGSDALMAKLNTALDAIRKNGEYEKAYDTWLRLK